MGKLTPLGLKALSRPGRHTNGAGLHLLIQSNGHRGWVLRFMRAGKLRDMGLGSYPEFSLARAREAAQTARVMISSGADPITERRRKQAHAAAPDRTFRIVAERLKPFPGLVQTRRGRTPQTAQTPGPGPPDRGRLEPNQLAVDEIQANTADMCDAPVRYPARP